MRPGHHRAQPHLRQPALERPAIRRNLRLEGRVAFLRGKFAQFCQLAGPLGKVAPLVHLPLEGGELLHQPLSVLGIVPEAVR